MAFGFGNTLAELAVKISVDAQGLATGLKDAEKQVATSSQNMIKNLGMIGGAMMAVSATILGTLAKCTMTFAQTAEDIDNMSKRTGMSAKTLQELKFAAGKTGASIEGMEVAVKRMQVALYAAKQGGKEAIKTFDALGISIDTLQGLKPDEQFMAIAEALAEIEDPGDRAALAVDLFGRSGTDLLPMLADGAAGLDLMRQKAHELGVVMSDETVKKGAELQSKIEDLKASFEGLVLKIGSSTEFQGLIEKLTNIIIKIADWIDKNPELIKALTAVAIAIGVMGAALIAAATAMIILQSVSGPVGWAALGIGAAVAAAAIYGMYSLLEPQPSFVFEHPGLASGGIVTQPTLAMVGESGPEAIVPLNQMGGDVNYHLYIDGEQITDVVEKRMANRLSAYGTKGYI